jgi:uncharacterized protein YjiS (DUF1127 family)
MTTMAITKMAALVSVGAGPLATARRIARSFLSWHRRRQDRLLLSALDDRLLRDIGLTRTAIIHGGDVRHTESWRMM